MNSLTKVPTYYCHPLISTKISHQLTQKRKVKPYKPPPLYAQKQVHKFK